MGEAQPVFNPLEHSWEVFRTPMSEATVAQRPHLRITPPAGWASLNLSELWRYRELLWFFTLRDITVRYKQTLLGPFWIVMMPLFSSGLFSLIFGVMAGMKTGDANIPYPVFVFSGMLVWSLFSKALSKSSSSLRTHQNLVTKIYFTRLIIPTSAAGGAILDFVLGAGILGILVLVTGIRPGWHIVFFPVFVVLSILVGLAVGLWLAALSVRYRDFGQVATFMTSMWMWLTPVAYPASELFNNQRIPPGLRQWIEVIYQLNPMYSVVQGLRWSVLGYDGGAPNALSLISLVVLVVVLIGGLYCFQRAERTMADVV